MLADISLQGTQLAKGRFAQEESTGHGCTDIVSLQRGRDQRFTVKMTKLVQKAFEELQTLVAAPNPLT